MRWDNGNGRITVIYSKTDVEAEDAVVAVPPVAMRAPNAICPVDVRSDEKVLGLSESQVRRCVVCSWMLHCGHFLAMMRAVLPIVPVAQPSTAAADKLTLVVRRQNP